MATFTLRERSGTGVDVVDPCVNLADPNAPSPDDPGVTILVVDVVLEDSQGNQRGTFIFRGVIARNLGLNGFAIAFNTTNKFDEGTINTQGVLRTADATNRFAITGGTGKYKKAHGTVTRKVINSVPHFTFKVR
jgi:Dirigent-like protein